MAGSTRVAITCVLALLAPLAPGCVGELDGPPLLRGSDTTGPGDRSTTGIPRLSRREIEASVRDVLGIEGSATRNLPADPPLAVDPATGAEGEVFDTLIDTKEPNQVFVEGLVHISNLPGDYYHFDPLAYRLEGERFGRCYRLGDALRVQVARVDLDERKIDFMPADADAAGTGLPPTPRKPSARPPRSSSRAASRSRLVSSQARKPYRPCSAW